MKVADNEDNIVATVIALYAQKAIDSINHQYIITLLNRIRPQNFESIFKLSHKGLKNDILIKIVKIGKCFNLGNGVKQDNVLNCSLFTLTIEPLVRNINKNTTITEIRNRTIDLTSSKIFGYADDVTIIIENANNSVIQIFHKYGRLTKASGLKLNADKTKN